MGDRSYSQFLIPVQVYERHTDAINNVMAQENHGLLDAASAPHTGFYRFIAEESSGGGYNADIELSNVAAESGDVRFAFLHEWQNGHEYDAGTSVTCGRHCAEKVGAGTIVRVDLDANGIIVPDSWAEAQSFIRIHKVLTRIVQRGITRNSN